MAAGLQHHAKKLVQNWAPQVSWTDGPKRGPQKQPPCNEMWPNMAGHANGPIAGCDQGHGSL